MKAQQHGCSHMHVEAQEAQSLEAVDLSSSCMQAVHGSACGVMLEMLAKLHLKRRNLLTSMVDPALKSAERWEGITPLLPTLALSSPAKE